MSPQWQGLLETSVWLDFEREEWDWQGEDCSPTGAATALVPLPGIGGLPGGPASLEQHSTGVGWC